jgi:hypothetical protein
MNCIKRSPLFQLAVQVCLCVLFPLNTMNSWAHHHRHLLRLVFSTHHHHHSCCCQVSLSAWIYTHMSCLLSWIRRDSIISIHSSFQSRMERVYQRSNTDESTVMLLMNKKERSSSLIKRSFFSHQGTWLFHTSLPTCTAQLFVSFLVSFPFMKLDNQISCSIIIRYSRKHYLPFNAHDCFVVWFSRAQKKTNTRVTSWLSFYLFLSLLGKS